MPNKRLILLFLLIVFAAVGCASPDAQPAGETAPASAPTTAVENTAEPQRTSMGPGSGMMARHHAQIPDEYAGLLNLVPADEDSLQRGAAIFEEQCVSCHGDGGMGDGPAGVHLDPQPAPIAHTSRMLGDDYLFWRISEGGGHEPFSSAMPRWQDLLSDSERWDVINYVRALGSGQVMPGSGPRSGETFDPAVEAARHAQMAADGVAQDVLSQEEADTFNAVHAELDRLMAEEMAEMSGGMENMQETMLSQLVSRGIIGQSEADMFSEAHDKLLTAGLME